MDFSIQFFEVFIGGFERGRYPPLVGMKLEDVLRGAQRGRALSEYRKGVVVKGGGTMGLIPGYKYTLEADPSSDFDPRFTPALTPGEILFMGVFEGKYLNDCTDEFPKEWFLMAAAAGRLSPEGRNVAGCNYFGVDSRQPLSVWGDNGWLPLPSSRRVGAKAKGKGRDMLASKTANPDERGWFQWYCRYWLGRRIPDLDAVQIGRWRSFARHVGAIRHGCVAKDLSCRRRERQALLQWAYDPFI